MKLVRIIAAVAVIAAAVGVGMLVGTGIANKKAFDDALMAQWVASVTLMTRPDGSAQAADDVMESASHATSALTRAVLLNYPSFDPKHQVQVRQLANRLSLDTVSRTGGVVDVHDITKGLACVRNPAFDNAEVSDCLSSTAVAP